MKKSVSKDDLTGGWGPPNNLEKVELGRLNPASRLGLAWLGVAWLGSLGMAQIVWIYLAFGSLLKRTIRS